MTKQSEAEFDLEKAAIRVRNRLYVKHRGLNDKNPPAVLSEFLDDFEVCYKSGFSKACEVILKGLKERIGDKESFFLTLDDIIANLKGAKEDEKLGGGE
jgi:hypothetical protein